MLRKLLKDHNSVSLAGMCKNAGKTTVLNRLLQELGETNIRLGITSIGRDGEARDVVTGTSKPGIYIKEGTVFATAAGLFKNCDTTSEILKLTGIHTPLGEVVLVRARSDGFVDLAGPSMNRQLEQVSRLFWEFGAEKIIIDGAVGRRSLCSKRVAQAVILCTGASYHRDMETVISDTAYTAGLLQLKGGLDERVRQTITDWRTQRSQTEKILFLSDSGEGRRAGKGQRLEDAMREKEKEELPLIWLEGAFTDAMAKPLLLSNLHLKEKCFVVEDSTKLLLGRKVYEKLLYRGARILVMEEIKLLAVTVNPFSAYGHHFEKEIFLEKMQQAVNLPVINVMEEIS